MDRTGYQLSNNYPRMLAGFAAWAGFGITLVLFATGQYLFGGVLVLLSVGLVVVAIRGGRSGERAYSRVDLVIQWIMLAIPIALAFLLLILAILFFRPYAVYAGLYLVVLVILAAVTGRELRRRMPVDQSR